MEYNRHKCTGYNVSCTFFNYEKNIVTGSEDKTMVIYNTDTGKVAKVLKGFHPSVVHLVASCADNHPMKLVSSSIENVNIIVWSPQKDTEETLNDKQEENTKPSFESALTPDEEAFLSTHRTAVESLMQKYGDKILKIFHQYNFTFSCPLDWQQLLSNVGQDEESAELLQMVNEMATDFAKAFDYYRTSNDTSPPGVTTQDFAHFLDNNNNAPNSTIPPSDNTPNSTITTYTTSARPSTTTSTNEDSTSINGNDNDILQTAIQRTPDTNNTHNDNNSTDEDINNSMEDMYEVLLSRQHEREERYEQRAQTRKNKQKEKKPKQENQEDSNDKREKDRERKEKS